MNQWLAETLGDTREIASYTSDGEGRSTPARADHADLLEAWAHKLPAMRLGLIPHEPKPERPQAGPCGVRAAAIQFCKDNPDYILKYDAMQTYGIGQRRLECAYTTGEVEAVEVRWGISVLVVYKRASVERLARSLGSAKAMIRTEATSPSSGVVHDGPVAAARQGRSRHCGNGRGSHGCGPDFTAPRVGKERQARGATLSEQEVAS